MKCVPSKPEVIIRSRQSQTTHVFLEKHDGKTARLLSISESCGGFYHFYCSIEFEGKQYEVDGGFIEIKDMPGVCVPDTHLVSPLAKQAWLFCHYRDEAWLYGDFTPKIVLPSV